MSLRSKQKDRAFTGRRANRSQADIDNHVAAADSDDSVPSSRTFNGQRGDPSLAFSSDVLGATATTDAYDDPRNVREARMIHSS